VIAFRMTTSLWRGTIALCLLASTGVSRAGAQTTPRKAPASPYASLRRPTSTWSQADREIGFAHWDSIWPSRAVPRGATVHPLPIGAPLAAFAPGTGNAAWLDGYFAEQHVAGLIVIQAGRIRLERYGIGYDSTKRWTSQSVSKSITSTLVGAALKDGYIRSLDDPVSRYVAGLRGSADDRVTIRQLLTMTSGVRWTEDYTDTTTDTWRFYSEVAPPGMTRTVSYMRKLPREAPPGTKWSYSTGETHLLGVLVSEATKKPLSQYLSEKIWAPYGMEHDAAWELDPTNSEMAGCCLHVALRDYARFGQFILDGAKIDGKSIVADGYLEAATSPQVETGIPGRGYGYQWWTSAGGRFSAVGIYGQMIHIDPKRQLIIVTSSAWPEPTSAARSDARNELIRRITVAVARENR
jgi:CubicO group peptidase (beta-lactamase class C family)